MRQWQRFFHRLFRRKRPVGSLDAAAMEAAMQEARFLRERYAVDAAALAPGETPGAPRAAKGEPTACSPASSSVPPLSKA